MIRTLCTGYGDERPAPRGPQTKAAENPASIPYDAHARDADSDGVLQEGTIWERPAGSRWVDGQGNEIAHGTRSITDIPNRRLLGPGEQAPRPSAGAAPAPPAPAAPAAAPKPPTSPLGQIGYPTLAELGQRTVADIVAPKAEIPSKGASQEPSGRGEPPSVKAQAPEVSEKIFRIGGRPDASPRFAMYDAFAHDGDGDGIVQEGTIWERPAETRWIDKFGREVADSLTLRRRRSDHRLVDSMNRPVAYTPTWERKPIGPPIGPRVKPTTSPPDDPLWLQRRQYKALNDWFMGATEYMREHLESILNYKPYEGGPYRRNDDYQLYTSTRYLMDMIADAEPFDGKLYRGESLPMHPKSIMHELAPGTEFVLPMRSFSRQEKTARDYFYSDHAGDFEHEVQVLYEMLPGSQGADFGELAKQVAEVLPDVMTEDDRFMLRSDVEHVIFGAVEVVSIKKTDDPKFGEVFHVVLKQIDTLGKPQNRDRWSDG